jgi:hypothetical protein
VATDPESARLPQPVPGLLSADIHVFDVSPLGLARVVAVSLVLALRTPRDLPLFLPFEGSPGMDLPGVDRFRRTFLPEGQLLAPDAVDVWVKQQAARDGRPSLWLAGVWVHPEQVEWDSSTGELILGRNGVPMRLAHLKGGSAPAPETVDEVPSYGPRWLQYSTPGWPNGRERVRAGGVLDQLRWLSMVLTDSSRWTAEQSTTFVLTGLIPIAWEYAQLVARRRQGGRHPRDMTYKHLELAAFTTLHHSETLASRMEQWNAAHPDWAYRTVQHFGGDSNQSIRRLMGESVLNEDRTQHGGRPEWPDIPPRDQRGGAAFWRS